MSLSRRCAQVGIVALAIAVLAMHGVGRAWGADAETQPTTHPALPIKVEVKLSSQKVKPGAACVAKVTVTNASAEVLFVKGGKGVPDIQPACWRRGERIVMASGAYAPEGDRLSLKPGESVTATLDMTAMYKLRKPGQYLFSATVQFSQDELGKDKEEDRLWVPSFRESASFAVSED